MDNEILTLVEKLKSAHLRIISEDQGIITIRELLGYAEMVIAALKTHPMTVEDAVYVMDFAKKIQRTYSFPQNNLIYFEMHQKLASLIENLESVLEDAEPVEVQA